MLESLKIVDLSTVLAGPSVGTFFAEVGAQVLKIENSKIPDVTRSWKLSNEDPKSSISAYFSSVNFKKNYIQLNLSESTDYNHFIQLISEADILISNFKKGDDGRSSIRSY
jgi:crotonobetainyl-CoA:carnitine CoA-transferase CaiB-like acyl-CoA transferase